MENAGKNKKILDKTGGMATCKTLAESSDCGTPYGTLDATNHESEEFTYVDNEDGTHAKTNACCDAVVGTVVHLIDDCGHG